MIRLRVQFGESPMPNKLVIFVWLPGGPSHMDMFDLKTDAPADYRGEFRPIPTNVTGMEICELLPRESCGQSGFRLLSDTPPNLTRDSSTWIIRPPELGRRKKRPRRRGNAAGAVRPRESFADHTGAKAMVTPSRGTSQSRNPQPRRSGPAASAARTVGDRRDRLATARDEQIRGLLDQALPFLGSRPDRVELATEIAEPVRELYEALSIALFAPLLEVAEQSCWGKYRDIEHASEAVSTALWRLVVRFLTTGRTFNWVYAANRVKLVARELYRKEFRRRDRPGPDNDANVLASRAAPAAREPTWLDALRDSLSGGALALFELLAAGCSWRNAILQARGDSPSEVCRATQSRVALAARIALLLTSEAMSPQERGVALEVAAGTSPRKLGATKTKLWRAVCSRIRRPSGADHRKVCDSA